MKALLVCLSLLPVAGVCNWRSELRSTRSELHRARREAVVESRHAREQATRELRRARVEASRAMREAIRASRRAFREARYN